MFLLQTTTVFFAIACAWLNKWPVYKFRESGASKKMERDFHAANALVKILFTGLACQHGHDVLVIVLVTLLIQWLVFDIALNLFTGRKWFYLGQTAKLDKWLTEGFDDEAGKVKAVLVFLIIVIINLFLL